MSLSQDYAELGSATRLDEQTARAIVHEAIPHALEALGRPTTDRLPVSTRLVEPDQPRGGSLIPAWPVRQADGSVLITHVADWGAPLAGWLATGDPAGRAAAEQLVRSGQRQWVGIANDVLQLFVPDPPPGTYSMVRHHGLMLAAATAWLGTEALRRWHAAHAWAAAGFLRRRAGQPPGEAIQEAEQGLEGLLSDARARQPAPAALAWLDQDGAARARYVDYLGAASLGVAAVLDAMTPPVTTWLARAVASLHPDPDFNRAWVERCAARLAAPTKARALVEQVGLDAPPSGVIQ
jgi:hypothetical protein